MGEFAAGQVVLHLFPYSNLSRNKQRPSLLIAPVGQGDWIACQITSNPDSDPLVIQITQGDFAQGGLPHISFARPSKLFTAHESLFASIAGCLDIKTTNKIRDAIVSVIRSN